MTTRVAPQIRTFELLVQLTGWPKGFPDGGIGSMDDLPANLQDGVMNALEWKAEEVGLPLSVIQVRIDVDIDKPDDAPDRIFLHVIVSEVVQLRTVAEMLPPNDTRH